MNVLWKEKPLLTIVYRTIVLCPMRWMVETGGNGAQAPTLPLSGAANATDRPRSTHLSVGKEPGERQRFYAIGMHASSAR